MGTETSNIFAHITKREELKVKLNNPLMGTETLLINIITVF